MDEFQRRYIELLKTDPYIQSITQPGREIQNVEYYVYDIVIGSAASPLVVNVPQTGVIETQADSDFTISFIAAAVAETANAAMVFNDNITVQIQDTATGKVFFSVPTVIGLVSGAGGFPFVLPAPRTVRPNTALAITALNRDTVINPIGLYLAFHGTRIYYK